jgi:hypothetical protein
MFPGQEVSKCGANCTGKCVLVGGLYNTYECIATSTYYFCQETMSTYWIVIACFVGINAITFVGAHINGGYKTDTCTFVVSIIQNAVFVTFIMGVACMITFSMNWIYMVSIQVGIFVGIMMNTITFCTLKAKRSRVCIFKDSGKIADMDSFDEYASKAHFNPPIVKVKGIANYKIPFVYNKRTIPMAFEEYIPYQSWRAESSPEPIELRGHLIVKVKNDFIFSESFKATINEWKRNIERTEIYSGVEISDYSIRNKVFCVKKKKLFGTSCLLSFYNSCFGKFLFVASHIFGLSAFMENIYGITTKAVRIRTKRTISGSNDLPTAALNPDSKAINGDICEQMPQSIFTQTPFFMGPNVMPMNQNQMQMNQMNQNHMQPSYIGGMQIQPQIGMPNPDYMQNPYVGES